MNREDYEQIVKKHFRNKKTKELFLEQIDKFYSYQENKIKNNYKIGDKVILKEGTLIHGTRINIYELDKISNNGLISSDFYDRYNSKKKKPWVVELWNIEKEMSLKDFLEIRCGVTLEFKANDGNTIKKLLCRMSDIQEEIKKVNNFRDYIIYQNQEQRFVPNDYINTDCNIAFIINVDTSSKKEYILNDIFKENFDKKILKEILPNWFYKKYFISRNFDNYETGREKGILFGLPSQMIDGILVSRKVEKNLGEIEFIKSKFPNVYICNLDGIVIK